MRCAGSPLERQVEMYSIALSGTPYKAKLSRYGPIGTEEWSEKHEQKWSRKFVMSEGPN